jgi:hypothetical protein
MAFSPLSEAPKTLGAQSVKADRADRTLTSVDESLSLEESTILLGEVKAFNNGEKAYFSSTIDATGEATFSLSVGFNRRAKV